MFVPKDEKEDGVSFPFPVFYTLPSYIFGLRNKNALQYLRQIPLSGYTHAHSLFAFPYCFLAARSARRAGIPFTMGAQGTYGVRPLMRRLGPRHMLMYAYRRAENIIVPSAFTKRMLIQHGNVPEEKISIIHNGVDMKEFSFNGSDEQDARRLYPGKKVLLTVGALIPRKGQNLVLEALPEIIRRIPDVLYIIIGEGRMRQEWERLAERRGVAGHVRFLGAVPDRGVKLHFARADVYVHTPRVVDFSFEGYGLVYLEAGACGTPSVAADAGGVRDAVVDGVTGLIAREDDVQDIAEKIIYLLSHDEKRQEMGRAARAYAEEHDWSRIAEQYLSAWKQAF